MTARTVCRALSAVVVSALVGGVVGCEQTAPNTPAFPTPPGVSLPPASNNAAKAASSTPVSNPAQDSARGGTPPK